MSETWDGRPENPDRDGWHWLRRKSETAKPEAVRWSVDHGWHLNFDWGWVSPSYLQERDWRYLGPCLTPAEIAAQVEAAERRGMERAADILRREAGHWTEWSAGELAANAEAAIRAQGHITDTDAEQGMREMRALAVWRVVERIEGNSHD